MTPSQERTLLKKVKDLIDANDELDRRQEKKLAGLKRRIADLKKTIDALKKQE